MPEFLVYYREKNGKAANVLFGGKPIIAADEEAAKLKAAKQHPGLRPSRLYAKPAPGPVLHQVTAKIVGEVDPLTPEQMKKTLGAPDA